MSGKTPVNPLEMSDEDFLKVNNAPPVVDEEDSNPDPDLKPEEEEQEPTSEGEDGVAEEDSDPGPGPDGDGENSEDDPEEGTDEGSGEDEGNDPEEEAETAETSKEEEPGESEETSGKPKKSDTEEEKGQAEEPNYKALYQQVMTPFKANGKTFEPKSIDEVIQLAQMGANYTKKLQDIQPHRKVLLMLENNDLLDTGKLSYLIDLDKKNPEAIKKLIKDAGIDPMDIDTESETDYSAGNHAVSDEEARFHEVVSEISSRTGGSELLSIVDKTWDEASKEVIWNQPDVLSVIQEQRESGVYDLITAEVDRQKTLNKISPSTPFLQAYKAVGESMAQSEAFASQEPKGNPKPEPVKVAERAAKPKPQVSNGDKAKAASTTKRNSSGASKKIVNPLALSDEEFMKMDNLKNRL